MTVNNSATLPFDADPAAPIFPSKNKDGNIPSRCESAPPYFGEALSTTRNPTVKNFYSGILGITDDEKLLNDPAYIAYYNAHVNLNPRLHSSDNNQDLNIKMSLLSTHQEEIEEDDALEDQSQFKDEIENRDNSAFVAGSCKSFAELIQGLKDHTRVPGTTDSPSVTYPPVKNDDNNNMAELVERKHENMLFYQTHGLPFYPSNSTIEQMQRFQLQTQYTPQAMNQSYNGMPMFSGTSKPVMLNQALVPPHYMNVGNQFGPRPQMMNTYGLGAYALPPGLYSPYFGGNLAQNMSSMPFDSYAHLNLLTRSATVQPHPQFPSPLPGQYFQHSFMDNNGRNAAQISQYDLMLAQKDPNLAAIIYHGHRNIASTGYNRMPEFQMNGRNAMVLGDHASIPQSSIERTDLYRGHRGQRGSYNVEDPKTHTYLEDLKYGGDVKVELSDIAGKIAELSTDQHGSRFIQTKLENSTVQEKERVFTEILPHASKLMIDVFGNYVIQKIFEFGTSEHRKQLADQFIGKMLTLSLQMYGCRVVQKALEVIEVDQKAALAKELDGHVIKCIHDQNGNHVIQKCIENIPVEEIGFIISSFHGQVATLSVHPYGCRVIQRALEHCSDTPATHFIMEEILDAASILAHDQYGNYVIQHILEFRKAHERSQVIRKMTGKFVEMSQHKYASNVIEKCLMYGNEAEQQSLIKEIVGRQEDGNILAMVKDQYANYVIQRILEICNDEEKNRVMNSLKENRESLRKYTYGKHLVARYDHLLSGNQEQKAG